MKTTAYWAALARRRAVQMDYACSGGHIGGALSCTDILTVLYHRVLRPQDHYIQSKGHCAEAWYIQLAQAGKIDDAQLDTYCQPMSDLYGHPTTHVPGIDVNTGALGHGLPIAVGVALGQRMDKTGGRSFVLMGDGEMGEGSIFEAMAAAAHYRLDNLVAVCDRNGLQISGDTEKVLALGDFQAKCRAYGWETAVVDGHDHQALFEALDAPGHGAPRMIIAKTIKGKGVSYMENVPSWHHGVMTPQQYQQALNELDQAILEASHEA
jgi:transketolase